MTLDQLRERNARHNANGMGVEPISTLEIGPAGACEMFNDATTYDAYQRMGENIYIYNGEISGTNCAYTAPPTYNAK